MSAFEINGDSMSRFTMVKSWNRDPTNKRGQLHNDFLTFSSSGTLVMGNHLLKKMTANKKNKARARVHTI